MLIRLLFLMTILTASLSGFIAGIRWIEVSDPDYTCLSFRNVTVQLDTSLFVRDSYPRDYTLSYSPDGNHLIYLEMETPHANRQHAVVINHDLRLTREYTTIIQSRLTGERRLIDRDITSGEFRAFWSPNSDLVVTIIWEPSGEHFIWGLYRSNGERLLKMNVSFYQVMGWSEDGLYFVFTTIDQNERTVFIINTQTLEQQIIAPFGPADNSNVKSFSFSGHQLALTLSSHLVVIDLESQSYVMHQFPYNKRVLGLLWSPDNRYIYQIYDNSAPTEIFRVTPEEIMPIAEVRFVIPSTLDVSLWSPDSRFLFYTTQDLNTDYYQLRRFDVETQRDELIAANLTMLATSNSVIAIHEATDKSNTVSIIDISSRDTQIRLEVEGAVSNFHWESDKEHLRLLERIGDDYYWHYFTKEGVSWHFMRQEEFWTHQDYQVFTTVTIQGDDFKFHKVNVDTGEKLTLIEHLDKTGLNLVDAHQFPESVDWLLQFTDGQHFWTYRFDVTAQALILLGSYTESFRYINLTWSPDNKHIAFITPAQDGFNLEIISTDGTGQKRLGQFPNADVNPIWTQCTY